MSGFKRMDKREAVKTDKTKNLRPLQAKSKSAHRRRLQQYVAGLDGGDGGGSLLAIERYQ
jgi:hypothetical protein